MIPPLQELLAVCKNLTPQEERLVTDAYEYSKSAHEGQLRGSGEPYFTHVFATAKILAEMHADAVTIAAGLLHDVLEDTNAEEGEMRAKFGDEVITLVAGVTKLGHIKYKGVARHAESLRKFFVASAHDIRVVTIKLADRLHNVSTLEHVPKEKQRRIAIETIDIYARLADRLGMGKMKSQLEDLAFPFAYPEEYAKTRRVLEEFTTLGEQHLMRVAENLREELQILDANITSLNYRTKHAYSLWNKLKLFDYDQTKIFDIYALRVLVPTVADCYQALGIIHGLYKPVPGKFKDYIAVPKPNGYQSLHTAIFDGQGSVMEVQIRTEEMHKEAEYGIYSHVGYKEGGRTTSGSNNPNPNKKVSWTQELLEAQRNMEKPEDFMKHLKLDFFETRVFAYTPKGDVIELPRGASVIDFAYAIHSDIGNHMFGARINNKMVPIDAEIEQGDIVEILRKDNCKPTRKWLDMCKTTFARTHIRKYLREHGGVIDKMLLS
ncbi:MAG: (p)ppGpp synthetase SpoT/RelA, pyrophosphokinae [Patescibacteria group bacterium]|nr:(p)ppGpp synthetase SpoT/RelA, pyrophosphokinae [Patescibacteria group bacterium]